MIGGKIISSTVQTLIETDYLSRSTFSFERELSHDIPGILVQPQHHEGSDGSQHNSPLRFLNAVKLSLMLTRAYCRCYNDLTNNEVLPLLRLEDFVVKLQCSPNADEEAGETPREGEEHLLSISCADQLKAITSTGRSGWVLLDMNINDSDARISSANMNIANLMQCLGNLLHAIFSQNNDAPAPEAQGLNNRERDRGIEETQIASKMRRSSSKCLFQQLIELGYPISISRLLNDLVDRGSHHPLSSFDDVIHDLEQMNSQPFIFLHNPENEFYTLTIHFGQNYYGRSKELAKLLAITSVPNEQYEFVGLEIIFVSGTAGSGKSHLVSAAGKFVSSFGFMVLTAKFRREMEYESREIVSTLMDDMVKNLVEMKNNGEESDVDYSNRVAQAISNALDADSLSSLVDFVPSIQSLIPQAVRNESSGCTPWQLVFLLSKLLYSVLSQERKILIALDDLQWTDPTTLGLMGEILFSMCQYPEERQHLVFVGMYRDDVISSDLTSFTTSFTNHERGGSAHVTDIKLSTLSLDDVIEMIMSELRLPRRLVYGLADVVHKRTHGHALFVVQLLNSLISDSTISYSPMLQRFYWDQDMVSTLKTADSVASLIVSNLESLPDGGLQFLRIISCFGIQVQFDLLELLEALAPQEGFKPYLQGLIDQGVIEIVSTMLVFTHDLIQEQVYEGIPGKERLQLHCDIGIFLGSKTSLDVSCENKPIDAAIEQLYLSDASDNRDSDIDVSSLVAIATSQINNAGPGFFSDREQHIRFASWNLRAGKDAAEHSSFRAALYYYKNGIAFLGDECWLEDTFELCLKLYEGAAFSSSALGESSQISIYTNYIINNVNFEDSLVAEYLLIGSLSASGRCKEAVARGLAVLRQLKFDIPVTPSPMVVMQAMEQTGREASMYNLSQIANCQKRADSKTRNIMKLVGAISAACYTIASPCLPLVAYAAVRYSLQNGVCEESASAFVLYAYFQLFLEQSFETARQWGKIAEDMLEKASAEGPVTTRARLLLFPYVKFWFVPLQETINHMKDVHDLSMKVGDTESACIGQCMRFKFLFFRGERLSILSHEVDLYLQSMTRFSIGSATFSTLDKEMIDLLVGDKSSNPYAILGGEIYNKESLLADAKSKMHFQIVESVHIQNFFVLFWMGDYAEAAKASDIAMSSPSAKMPKVNLVYHVFYRGIVAFDLYRDGNGDKWLKEGNRMQDQVEKWVANSKPIFENKLILLEAERYASMCNVVAAKESYELSIKVARDNGYIHEQGLAYELMGKYLMSIVEVQDAERCFLKAHKCYMQWGAVAKANKMWKDWNLGSRTENIEITPIKHGRDE